MNLQQKGLNFKQKVRKFATKVSKFATKVRKFATKVSKFLTKVSLSLKVPGTKSLGTYWPRTYGPRIPHLELGSWHCSTMGPI